MSLLLLILSILNLAIALIAYYPSFLTPVSQNFRELSTIALSSTKQRKLYSLILGLMSCLVLPMVSSSTPEFKYILASTLVNIATLLLSYITQLKLSRNLHNNHATKSIAVIKLEGGTTTPIELWLKKSDIEWPPINLEIGMGPWAILASCTTSPILNQIQSVLKESKLLKEMQLQKDLKKVLNQHGVTHPMDIDGVNCIPEIKEFFEKTLITAS